MNNDYLKQIKNDNYKIFYYLKINHTPIQFCIFSAVFEIVSYNFPKCECSLKIVVFCIYKYSNYLS